MPAIAFLDALLDLVEHVNVLSLGLAVVERNLWIDPAVHLDARATAAGVNDDAELASLRPWRRTRGHEAKSSETKDGYCDCTMGCQYMLEHTTRGYAQV